MISGKIRLLARLAMAAMLLGAGPTTQPAENADAPVPMAALPEEFAILQTRNVFGTLKNHSGSQAAGGPDAGFVLKGVVLAGAGYTAFVEELASKQVRPLVVGDTVSRGKIKSIDIDTIEYEVSGSAHRIEVGQDLNGRTPPPSPPPPPTAPQGGGKGNAPPGQPSAPAEGGPGQQGPPPQMNVGPQPNQ